MSSNLSIKFTKKLNSSKTLNSSELSSDSETNEALDVLIDNPKTIQIQQEEKIPTTEFITPKRLLVEKRPRFFSENSEKSIYQTSNIEKIKNNLKKIVEEELKDFNKRKFSFV